jgi:hypothetical protein
MSMAKRERSSDDFDSPWKDALHFYLRAFLAFFFRDIHADIDWSREYVALDKEFQQIIRQAKIGKRVTDKLFKVLLRSGEECWILIHIEVQGERDDDFPERMFNYNSAIRKLYNQDVVSLAVLCDDDPVWQPTSFGYGRWDCRMELTFRVAKLLECADKQAALEASDNPFALIVAAHLKAIATRRDPQRRRDEKLRLVKLLLSSGMPKDDIRKLFRLIDWIMTLPADLAEAFGNEIYQYEKENKMEYITSIERIGIAKGERSGLLQGIEALLDAKFGVSGRKLMKKVNTIQEISDLQRFMKFLKKAATLEKAKEYFNSSSYHS